MLSEVDVLLYTVGEVLMSSFYWSCIVVVVASKIGDLPMAKNLKKLEVTSCINFYQLLSRLFHLPFLGGYPGSGGLRVFHIKVPSFFCPTGFKIVRGFDSHLPAQKIVFQQISSIQKRIKQGPLGMLGFQIGWGFDSRFPAQKESVFMKFQKLKRIFKKNGIMG